MRIYGFKIVKNNKHYWVKFGFILWFRVSPKVHTLAEARDQRIRLRNKFSFNGLTKTVE